ncbi:Uncharacterised protein [Mycobacteroides abscessus subsp. abscessus]|nr:Uncharacterised protein [Mycobacteroides abscessus subsp. abscessus]
MKASRPVVISPERVDDVGEIAQFVADSAESTATFDERGVVGGRPASLRERLGKPSKLLCRTDYRVRDVVHGVHPSAPTL